MKYSFLIFIFTFCSLQLFADDCLESLKVLSANKKYRAQINEYLGLQGKLTLHKLTWAAVRNSDQKKSFKLEREIDSILTRLDTNRDPKFREAKRLYENNKLSRTALARILPFVTDILNDQLSIKDPVKRHRYSLQENDLKLLSILAEKEAKRSNSFDHRLFKDHKEDLSILNFTTIINSSLKDKKNDQQLQATLKQQIKLVQKDMKKLLANLPLPEDCYQYFLPSCQGKADVTIVNKNFLNFMQSFEDFDKHQQLRYGDFWLHTSPQEKKKQELASKVISPKKSQITPLAEIPKQIEEKVDDKLYFNKLAEQVLSRYPYFLSKEKLLHDKELLLSLAQALDQGKTHFYYRGTSPKVKKYILPEGYNRSALSEEGKKNFDFLLTRLTRIPTKTELSLWEEMKRLKKLAPNSFDKETAEEFYHTILGANFGKKRQKAFEFRGKLYHSESGLQLERSKKGLLNFAPATITKQKSPYDLYLDSPREHKQSRVLAAKQQQQSYEYKNSLYHLSGVQVDLDKVMAKKSLLSLKKFKRKLKTQNRDKAAQNTIVAALLADESHILLDNQVINPKTLDAVSLEQMKLTINNYQAQNHLTQTTFNKKPDFLKKWYLAISNHKPTYYVDGKRYSTMTGKEPEKVLLATNDNYVHIDQEQIAADKLNMLDDTDLIRGYHRIYSQDNDCKHYTIIDKKKKTLSVFNLPGELLFQREVLTGETPGDKRTIFHEEEYKKGLRLTNGKTAAGIFYTYDFRTSEDHEFYDFYNNNIMALVTEKGSYPGKLNSEGLYETVLSLHQVPKGYEDRLPLFNNDRLDDNNVSNGCINLLEKDFIAYKEQFGKASCPFYVLPEETNSDGVRKNRFKIIGQQLAFTPVDRSDCESDHQCDLDYYYSRLRPEKAKPIKMILTNNNRLKNKIVEQFVTSLEDSKPELMQKLKISNEDYNQLAELSYAILGVESGFGEEYRYRIKEGDLFENFGRKLANSPIAPVSFLTRGISKLLINKSQAMGQKVVNIAKKFDSDSSPINSRGLTQIKNIQQYTKEHYPKINDDNLDDPDHAAKATIIVLHHMRQQLKRIQKEHHGINPNNEQQFLYYIFNGSPSQIKGGAGGNEISIRLREIKKYLDEVQVYQSRN